MNSRIIPAASRRLLQLSAALAALTVMIGCSGATGRSAKTSIQLQAFQSKHFETSGKTAFAATMSVFQDLGYTIGTADLETGFISAQSPTKKKGGFLFYYRRRGRINATAYLTPLDENRTKIRLNFVDVTQTSSLYGVAGGSDRPIEDPKVYQDAFTKISKAIFVIENVGG
jgi:hypothetical protein